MDGNGLLSIGGHARDKRVLRVLPCPLPAGHARTVCAGGTPRAPPGRESSRRAFHAAGAWRLRCSLSLLLFGPPCGGTFRQHNPPRRGWQ